MKSSFIRIALVISLILNSISISAAYSYYGSLTIVSMSGDERRYDATSDMLRELSNYLNSFTFNAAYHLSGLVDALRNGANVTYDSNRNTIRGVPSNMWRTGNDDQRAKGKDRDFNSALTVLSTFYYESPAKKHMSAGDKKINEKKYWEAIAEYDLAIKQGMDTYDVHYKRGYAFYCLEMYQSAIQALTKAIQKQRNEEAYLLRGMAKIYTGDSTAIYDLKRGGNRGEAIALEIESQQKAKDAVASTGDYVSSGTGFFVTSTGMIATNYHVVEKANSIDIYVTKQGVTNQYKGKVIISDKTNDLALLKISDNSFQNISAIPYTFYERFIDVGNKVFAMGYPALSALGEEIKVTDGIISSKTGYQGDITTYQISAPIQPGNSGGPLFDSYGRVVGITNAGIPSLQNVGYAIKTTYLLNLIYSCPETVVLPSKNQLSGMSLSEKVKTISPYIVIIKIK